jgi:hypothetical protein
MKCWLFLLLFVVSGVTAQTTYSVYLKPKQIPGLMGLQSFAFGQHDGKWIIIGGRLDGLHRRQPFAAFDSIGHNNQVIVIDPKTDQLWKAPVDGLSPALRDQLKGTNIGFTQEGTRLILAGGYGISGSAGNHITFPFLTTVDLPRLIEAVQRRQLTDDLFEQIEDPAFAVTGGQLQQLGNVFYLVGGHRFDGRYNPADRPTFTQTYTNAVRRFYFDKEDQPVFLSSFGDSLLMHRRDFNVVLNRDATGKQYLTAFSGVFQHGADLPFLTAIHIDNDGLAEQPGFRQYYNHYHCPDFSYYDAATQEMNTLFFGGIAQYYDSLGTLLQDNDVPFVTTISRVVRRSDGAMTEYRLPVEMPALLGAGGEFIPNRTLDAAESGVPIVEPGQDSLFIGTIVGGIASTGRNIFWINDDEESAAHSGMFEVYLVKSSVPQIQNPMSNSPVNLRAVRHATEPRYTLKYTLSEEALISVEWSDVKGKVRHRSFMSSTAGDKVYPKFLPKKPGVYEISLTVSGETETIFFKVPEED